MTLSGNDADFMSGWNEFSFADAVGTDADDVAPNNIMDWGKPPPPDENWTDPLGLQEKENSGTVVEQKADGTSESVARTWLEDYMSDKPDHKQTQVEQVTQNQNQPTVAETLLNEQPKQQNGNSSNPLAQAIPLMAGAAAGGAGKGKSASNQSSGNAAKEATPVQLPTLNATWVDDAFKRQNEEFKYSGPNANSEIRGDWAGHNLQWRNENLGWDLGHNNEGSFIRRGTAALGITDPSKAYEPIKENAPEGDVYHHPSQYEQLRQANHKASEAEIQAQLHPELFSMAQQLGLDLSQYLKEVPTKIVTTYGNSEFDSGEHEVIIPASIGFDIQKLYSDLEGRTQNLYRVGGIHDNLPGSTHKGGQIVESFYVRDGDKLVPVGEQTSYQSKENSKGFIGDMVGAVKDFGMDIMSDPVLAGIVGIATAGAATPLASSISAATGMGATASTIAANSLVSAGTAAITGGDPLKAALTAGASTGVGQMNLGAKIAPTASAAVQRGINNFIGNTVTSGDPLAALKSAGIGVATNAIAPDIAKAISSATGIDPKNAAQITNWAIKNAPALLQGKNLNAGQVASLISASIPKRSKS